MRRKAESTTNGKPEGLELRSLAATWRQVMLPMVAGIVTTKKALHEWVTDMGMAALVGVMEADAQRVVGCRKGGHQDGRRLGHWGYTDTPFPYDGRQVVLPRPRVRTADKKQEVTLPSVRQFQSLDPMSARVVDQILLGVSTRGYEASLGPGPEGLRTKGAKKSRVSEVFVEETRRRMKDRLAEKLDELDLVAMLLDGVHVAEHAIVVGLGVSRDGHKHILGLRQGSTENATLCTELLQDFVGRGLKNIEGLLYVIDGGKGLRAAIRDVAGNSAVVQRCQQHKRRNVVGHLPQARQKTVDHMLVEAYKSESLKTARKRLGQIVSWLDRNGEEDAAASLREGMEETLTVWKLGLPEQLRRFFATTNAIENVLGVVRRVSRNVKNWRDGAMAKRWTGIGLVAAEKRFKRIKGHRHMPALVEALSRRAAKGIDQEESAG
jgi:putative transposase